MNFSMMIGLAVGIDYSLFIVSRYREEREDGKDAARRHRRHPRHRRQGRVPLRPHRRAVPGRGLRGAGHGLPVDGPRDDPVGHRHRRGLAHPAARRPRRPGRPGAACAKGQERPRPRRRGPLGPLDRPRPCAGPAPPSPPASACCSLLAAPALGMRLGMPGAGVVDEGRSEPRRLRRWWSSPSAPGAAAPLFVTVPAADAEAVVAIAAADPGVVDARRRRRAGRQRVAPSCGSRPTTAVDDQATSDLVGRLRDGLDAEPAPTPPSAGPGAQNHDLTEALTGTAPAGHRRSSCSSAFVLLLVVFRSLTDRRHLDPAQPASAWPPASGSPPSCSSTATAPSLLGIEHQGFVDAWAPLFFFALLFGLSMDYQLFLLAAIKERHDATGDAQRGRPGGHRPHRPAHHQRRPHHDRGVRRLRRHRPDPARPSSGVTLAAGRPARRHRHPDDARAVPARDARRAGLVRSRPGSTAACPTSASPTEPREGDPPCSSSQYDLACLSLYSYLIGDETTGRAVVVDPQRDITEYLADAEAHGLRIERVIETHFHADFLSGPPRAGRGDRRGHLLRRRRRGRLPDRAARPHGQRLSLGEVDARDPAHARAHAGVDLDRGATSTPTPSRGACSPATRCSSATSAGPTCSPRSAGPPTSLARRPLPVAARAAPDPARRHPRVPGPRRRLGVRQEPVDRGGVDDRRAAAPPTTPSRPMTEDAVRRGRHRGPGRRRRSTSPSPPTRTGASASCSTTHEPPAALDARRGPRRSARTGAVLLDTRAPGVLRLRAPARVDQRRPRRPLRRVRRRRRPARPAGRAPRRRRAAAPRPRSAWPASASTTSSARSPTSRRCSPTSPSSPTAARRLPAADVGAWLRRRARPAGRRRPQPGRGGGRGTIPGAVNLPLPAAARPPRRARPGRARRSSTAPAATARRSPRPPCGPTGFRTVADLIGGYGAWADGGEPVEAAAPPELTADPCAPSSPRPSGS